MDKSTERTIMCPTAAFGESVNFSASRFTKLKSKGDKIRFRLLGAPFYDGKHFRKIDDEWDISDCPRINEGINCSFCEEFFKAHAQAKKEGLEQKEAQKLTDPWKASISFYYPVINRETQAFEVFQTTKSVRDKIEAELELGTKILERDLVVMRTEAPGTGYYVLSVVDSSDTKELSKAEKAAVKKGKATNLSDYVHGKEDDNSGVAFEANSETQEDEPEVADNQTKVDAEDIADDIPF